MKPVTIILIITVVVGFGSVAFFFSNNRALVSGKTALEGRLSLAEQELLNLKDEKVRVETELAVFKTTDLDKEAELLRLKLKNAENEFAATEKKVVKLETNLSKMKPYAEALTAIDYFFSRPMAEANLKNIDFKVGALNDSQISAQWREAKANINIDEGSWGTREISHTLFLITSKIRGLAL